MTEITMNAPMSGLGKQKQADDRHRKCHRHHGAKEALFHLHFSHHVVSGIKKNSEFGEFGRLKVDESHGYPPPCAVDSFSNERNQHQNQKKKRQDKKPGGQLFPDRHRNLKNQNSSHERKCQRKHMTQQEMCMRIAGKFRVVRHGNRRGINHHQAHHYQSQGDPHQSLIKSGHAMWRCRGFATDDVSPCGPEAHRKRRGWRRKTSQKSARSWSWHHSPVERQRVD